jgi:hypothetical protein
LGSSRARPSIVRTVIIGAGLTAFVLLVVCLIQPGAPQAPRGGPITSIDEPEVALAAAAAMPASRNEVTPPPTSNSWLLAVVDSADVPIADTEVLSTESLQMLGKTDARGELVLPERTAAVVAHSAAHLPASVARDGRDKVTLVLPDACTLTGIVLDQDGAALADAVVRLGVGAEVDARLPESWSGVASPGTSTARLIALRSDGSTTRSFETRTAADGTFRLRGVPRGRHVMLCVKLGYVDTKCTGSAEGRAIEVRFQEEHLEIGMRRVFVAVTGFVFGANWPERVGLSLTRRTLSAPSGLSLVDDKPVASQLERLPEVGGSGVAVRRFVAAALEGSRLVQPGQPHVVRGSMAVDVWGKPRREEPMHFVPLDLFTLADATFVDAQIAGPPRTVVLASPFRLTLLSLEPRGFGFEPTSTDGEHQVFLVPDGTFEVTAEIPILLRSRRREEIVVTGDTTEPRRLTAFEGIGRIQLSVAAAGKTADGERVLREGGFVVTAKTRSRGDVAIPVAMAASTPIPCEPGDYEVCFVDQSGSRIASRELTVAAGEVAACRIDLP